MTGNAPFNNLASVFEEGAKLDPDLQAIKFNDQELTYKDLAENIQRLSVAMINIGLNTGNRIAILSKNCPECIELIGAAATIGACVTPINYRLLPSEIEYIVGDCRPMLWLVSNEFIEVAIDTVRNLKADITIISIGETKLGYQSYSKWIAGEPFSGCTKTSTDSVDLFLLYTSGTTGLPKGVRINNKNYRSFLSAISSVPGFSYSAHQVVATPMPLFHIAGINVVMAALAQQCSVLLVADYQPDKFLRMMGADKANHVFLAPSMIVSLLNALKSAPADISELQTIAYGASPISSQLLKEARELFGCEFAQLYGMTESTGAGTYLSPSAHDIPGKYRSCGVAWPNLEIKVIDSDGRVLDPGISGEIAVRGEVVTPGYLNRPEETEETIKEGWLRTGDAGFMDEDGYVYIRDRIKDLIITGGENVAPNEVEDAIASCPGVVEVAVIGVPSEKWGEEVKALVVTSQPRKITEFSVICWAKRQIAGFKVPKTVEFIDQLPRNASGKILKRELRRKYWSEQDRQVN